MLPFGLKAADKLVDDHFHKIPNHFFHPNTYSVKKSKRQHAKERVREHERQHEGRSQDRDPDSDNGIESDPDDEFPDVPRHSGAPQSSYEPQYTASPIHSQEPPQLRREYVPSSTAGSTADSAPPRRQYDISPPPSVSSREPPPAKRYYDPPPQNSEPPRNQLDTLPPPPRSPPRNRAPSMDSPKRYEYPPIPKSQFVPPPPLIGSPDYRQSRRQSRDYPPAVQPPAQRIRRRGRSLHDRDRDSEYSRTSRPKIVTRRSSSYHHSPRSRHDYGYVTANDRIQQHREVKSEKKELFTDSPTGLAGGAVGAIVGGLAAQKAQRDRRDDPDVVLTLLGAAVGGLAVNAVVGKGEDKKQVEERVLHGSKDREHRRSRGSNGSVRYRESRGYGSDDGYEEVVSRSGSGRSHRRRHRESRGYGSDGYD